MTQTSRKIRMKYKILQTIKNKTPWLTLNTLNSSCAIDINVLYYNYILIHNRFIIILEIIFLSRQVLFESKITNELEIQVYYQRR